MAFLSHLSLQSYNFVKKPSVAQDDISVQRQINKYVQDLDQVIKTVCQELNESAASESQWTQTNRSVTNEKRRVPAVKYSLESNYQNHNQTIDVVIDYEGENSIEFTDAADRIDAELIAEFKASPAFKRYYEEIENNDDLKVKARFTAKQIYSKYFCDYLIHLIEHLAPIMNIPREALSEAA